MDLEKRKILENHGVIVREFKNKLYIKLTDCEVDSLHISHAISVLNLLIFNYVISMR